jgi:signal transduction histidine kinase
MGLRFMRQRVAEVGGSLRIKTACDRGTTIRVEVPYFERQLDEIAVQN